VGSRRATLIPVGQENPVTHAQNYVDHGRFFVDEPSEEIEELESPDQSPNTYTTDDSISPSTTTSSTPINGILLKFYQLRIYF
jgi:hypothetical protein